MSCAEVDGEQVFDADVFVPFEVDSEPVACDVDNDGESPVDAVTDIANVWDIVRLLVSEKLGSVAVHARLTLCGSVCDDDRCDVIDCDSVFSSVCETVEIVCEVVNVAVDQVTVTVSLMVRVPDSDLENVVDKA